MTAKLIMVAANEAWNLVNFRAGLIRSLRNDGYRVMALAPPDPVCEHKLRALGCEFLPIPVDSAGFNPLHDLRTLIAMVLILRRHRPAALLSWTIKPNIYGALAARLSGAVAIPNVSGLGTMFITRSVMTRLVMGLYRLAFAGVQTVFFQNPDDRDSFVSAGLVTLEQCAILPGSGIDPDHFVDAGEHRSHPRQFLLVARLIGDKGIREFVEAARIVRTLRPDISFSLLGSREVANRTAISSPELAAWLAAGIVTHQQSTDDVRPAMVAADVIVLPSYREGMSRVLLEAAAMARPIVTTDVPGCRDIVDDGVNGFLCAPRDANSLAAAMLRAAQLDDPAWRRMGLAGRARVLRDFSVERVIERYSTALKAAGVALSRAPLRGFDR